MNHISNKIPIRKRKTLPTAPKSAAALFDRSMIRVGIYSITASRCVRNLGVFIDRHLDMKKQVSQTVSACSFYLRHINQISSFFLAKPTKECVVNAIITYQLDYCNALLHDTYVVNIACPQRIHNSAARLILCRPRSDSARPVTRTSLAARGMQSRFQDNWYLVLTYKAMYDKAPVYLCELVRPYQRQEHCALPAVTVWK